MRPDTLIVLAIVGAAVAFIGRRAWQKVQAARRPKTGCGSDCGCGH